jgi:hypothetical protein
MRKRYDRACRNDLHLGIIPLPAVGQFSGDHENLCASPNTRGYRVPPFRGRQIHFLPVVENSIREFRHGRD